MGFFLKLAERLCNQAIGTMHSYADGRSNPVDAMNALKVITNGGKLFRRSDGSVYDLNAYFWVNGANLENVSRMTYTISSVSDKEIIAGYSHFIKDYIQDIEYIRFDRY